MSFMRLAANNLRLAARSNVGRHAAMSTAARTASAPKSAQGLGALALGAAAGAGVLFASGMGIAEARQSKPNFDAVRADIADIIGDIDVVNPSVDDGAQGGGGGVGPMLLRLAWHSSGTWSNEAKNGGSEGGTMRFSDEASHGGNAGLHHARALLEPVKAKHPDITYADLYILAGVVAVEEMGGPKVTFRWGRSDAEKEARPEDDSRFSPDGRLPDGHKETADGRPSKELATQHVRDVFYRMGFDDRAIVALCGAHGVGRCHTDRSGYWGPWTYAETTFSNEYFVKLLDESQGWTEKKTHKGAPWTGPPQFVNRKGDLMMLWTDMALLWDPSFRKWVEAYAKDEKLFFEDFAKYYQRLNELGCKELSGGNRRFIFAGPKET